TLACKAGSVGARPSLGGWLYRVAYRIALRARADAAASGRHEGAAGAARAGPAPDDPSRDAARRELRSVLDEDIARLSEKYRVPVVLCYIEGKTNEEAALLLGCPTGTVVTWLARTRERLRVRLAGRGVGVTAGALAALLAGPDVGEAVPPALRQ